MKISARIEPRMNAIYYKSILDNVIKSYNEKIRFEFEDDIIANVYSHFYCENEIDDFARSIVNKFETEMFWDDIESLEFEKTNKLIDNERVISVVPRFKEDTQKYLDAMVLKEKSMIVDYYNENEYTGD